MKYIWWGGALLFLACSLPCTAQQSAKDSLDQLFRERLRWRKDVEKIGEAAVRYRYRSAERGGGGDSYIGFAMPEGCDSSEFGTYSLLDIFPEKIVLVANLPFNKSPLAVQIDSLGKFQTSQWVYEYELNKIAVLACQYRTLPVSEGGGGGSYEGFTIPARYQWTAYGRYTVKKVQPDEIILRVNCSTERVTRDAIYDTSGRRHELGDYYQDVKKIQSIAYQYKLRPSSEGGGQGSYIGFTLPKNLDSTSNGKYLLYDIQPDELVLKVVPRASRFWYLFVFDSLGKEKYGGFWQYGNADTFGRNIRAIIEDIRLISKEAARYWRETKPTPSLQGSFDGFTIPDTLTNTANGSYSIVEVRGDVLYIRAVSSKGYGMEYFQIDGQGNQHRLIFGEYRPPNVQPKRIMRDDAQTMYNHADKHLHEIYQQLLVRKNSDERFIKKLRTAEQLWIKYRDAQLIEKFSQENSVSDKNKLTKSELTYLTILTEKRIKTLQELLDRP